MSEQLNIFGEHTMERSAVFQNGNRLVLRRRWGPGPIACVVGHNPSDAGAEKDDPTSRWWNAWFQLFGFGGYDAVNLYPWVTSDPRGCYEIVARIEGGVDWGARDELHYVNAPKVAEIAKAADQVFVCWGAIARDDDWNEVIIEDDTVRPGALAGSLVLGHERRWLTEASHGPREASHSERSAGDPLASRMTLPLRQLYDVSNGELKPSLPARRGRPHLARAA